MAGKTIPVNARIMPHLLRLSFVLDPFGDLIGFVGLSGRVTFLPAGAIDDSLTAFAGGGQASALPLNYRISRVTTVASAADSVVLPVGVPSMQMTVINAAASNSMNVFPATGDNINALGANTAFAVAANKAVIFTCTAVGQWHANLTA
jgi:hypothetical protein